MVYVRIIVIRYSPYKCSCMEQLSGDGYFTAWPRTANVIRHCTIGSFHIASFLILALASSTALSKMTQLRLRRTRQDFTTRQDSCVTRFVKRPFPKPFDGGEFGRWRDGESSQPIEAANVQGTRAIYWTCTCYFLVECALTTFYGRRTRKGRCHPASRLICSHKLWPHLSAPDKRPSAVPPLKSRCESGTSKRRDRVVAERTIAHGACCSFLYLRKLHTIVVGSTCCTWQWLITLIRWICTTCNVGCHCGSNVNISELIDHPQETFDSGAHHAGAKTPVQWKAPFEVNGILR